jgi:membrane protein implicated in regulation of membrane protease activity
MVVLWLVLGIVLLLFELHHLAFYALFGAIGSLAAAAVALFVPGAIAVQAGVAVAVAVAGVVAVRPLVSKAYASRRLGHVVRGVHGGLIGQQTITLDQVGDPHLVGHVRIAGERWLAVSGGSDVIQAGTPVLVTAVQGTTLVVWPVDGIDDGRTDPATPAHDEAPDGADGRMQ